MNVLKLYENDNVAIAIEAMTAGDTVELDGQRFTVLDEIPNAHKIALKDFAPGEAIIKYDNVIGYAACEIKRGQWVHTHNVKTGLDKERSYKYEFNPISIFPGKSDETFMGYERKDGSVGIRNHFALISTVFCANGPLKDIAKAAEEKYKPNDHFDGFISLNQEFGCSQTGKDLESLCRVVAGVVKNANFGGVLLVSLGCEMMIPTVLEDYLGEYDHDRIKYITLQAESDEVGQAMARIDSIMHHIDTDRRSAVNIGKLHVALNCGGSDGYSGITANTLLGTFCDTMVKKGATVNMTEVPEMLGAEHILMNRAADERTFEAVVRMIKNYEAYFARYGEKAADNPTQGNKAGGLSTLEDKSLGCIQKGGHCAVMEVLDYGERSTRNGFVLISGPGNDLAGVTGQIAAGAVLTLFTTGRGTPTGFAGPTFRLASNTALATRKPNWIDFDAGRLLKATTAEEKAQLNEELYQQVMDVVNGKTKTRNEKNGYYMMGGLKDGVVL